jgi:hypothetical protein
MVIILHFRDDTLLPQYPLLGLEDEPPREF